MIDLLSGLLAPLTLCLGLLLLLRKPLLNKMGAQSAYYMWLLLPMSLLFYSLPLEMFGANAIDSSTVFTVIFDASKAMKQEMAIDWVAYIWLGVSIGFASCWLTNHYNFVNNLNLKATDIDSNEIQLPKSLKVYQSAHVFSPMLVGLLKPKLVLPEHFNQMYDQEQQSLILQHEICHFSRNDIYWNLLAFSFLVLFWFHPLVWLAYFRFRCDQELSCDQTVLARKQLSSRINYSKALLVTAQAAPPIAFAQLSFNEYREKSIMFERIKHIKANTKMPKAGFAALSLLSIMTLSSMTYAGNVDTQAKNDNRFKTYPVVRIEPKYPKAAVEQQLNGSVVLKFDILENGKTDNISVVTADPAYVFDQSALAALAKWKYEAHEHGVITDNLVQLDFVLDDSVATKHLLERIQVQNH